MSTFRVRASSLGEVSAQLQSLVAVFDGHVSQVTAQVNAVSGVSWEGEDQQAFAERFSQWQQTADLVRMSLTTLSMQLVAAEGAYTQQESGVQGRMAQRRQEHTVLVDTVQEVDESVDTGLERARSSGTDAKAGVSGGGSLGARSGQGQRPGGGGGGVRATMSPATAGGSGAAQ